MNACCSTAHQCKALLGRECSVRIAEHATRLCSRAKLSRWTPDGEGAVEDLLEQAVAADGDDAVEALQRGQRQARHVLPRVVVPLRLHHFAPHPCAQLGLMDTMARWIMGVFLCVLGTTTILTDTEAGGVMRPTQRRQTFAPCGSSTHQDLHGTHLRGRRWAPRRSARPAAPAWRRRKGSGTPAACEAGNCPA